MTPPVETRGTLYLVGTPIGNLEDITLRALRLLKECDLIACEDTRQTQKLLNHYSVETRTTSYHEHNEREKAAELVESLEAGKSIAVVTDAGMPGISDPGYRLAVEAIARGIAVVPVPGACALLSALVASGLPTDNFQFQGFLPSKAGQRRSALEELKNSGVTQIFYEAPHRVVETLADIVDVMGAGRRVVIARELTKLHEEFLRATASEALAELKQRGEVRGEIVLMIAKAEAADEAQPAAAQKSVRQRVRELMAEGCDEREAMKRVAKEFGVGKSEVYREMQRGR